MAAAAAARPRKSPRAVPAMVLGALASGMMSSSCCVLQLALNYTSLGCAGFSALTPYAPHFRALTGGLLAALLLSSGLNRRSVATCAASLLLVFSQDMLAAANAGRLQQLLLGRPAPTPTPPPAATRYRLQLGGVRCEACAARVRGAVAQVPGVLNATVAFQEATLEVWGAAPGDGGAALSAQELVEAVGRAGYVATLAEEACYDDAGRERPCSAAAAPSAAQWQGTQQQGMQQGTQQQQQQQQQQQASLQPGSAGQASGSSCDREL